MPLFVIFGGSSQMVSIAEAAGAKFVKLPKNKLLSSIFRFHTSGKINHVINMPFKFLWDKVFFDGINISRDEEVYFIFYEWEIARSRDYLVHLKKKYSKSKFAFIFVNPLSYPPRMLSVLKDLKSNIYDAIITMNRSDAEKYGLIYNDYWPFVLPEKKFDPEKASDVFFVGCAKDRLPKILGVYERLAAAGIKCDFHVTEVPKNERKYADVIHYYDESYPMSYDEVLQRSKSTKCILEILPKNENYSSWRTNEALWYHKKLLTTNIEAQQEWFYNPEFVQCFRNADEIDTDFIKRPLSPEDEQRIFGGMNLSDFNRLANFIVKSVNKV